MVLELTQPLTKKEYQGYFQQGRGSWCTGLTILPPCANCLGNSGSLKVLEFYGLVQACTGIDLCKCNNIFTVASQWNLNYAMLLKVTFTQHFLGLIFCVILHIHLGFQVVFVIKFLCENFELISHLLCASCLFHQ